MKELKVEDFAALVVGHMSKKDLKDLITSLKNTSDGDPTTAFAVIEALKRGYWSWTGEEL